MSVKPSRTRSSARLGCVLVASYPTKDRLGNGTAEVREVDRFCGRTWTASCAVERIRCHLVRMASLIYFVDCAVHNGVGCGQVGASQNSGVSDPGIECDPVGWHLDKRGWRDSDSFDLSGWRPPRFPCSRPNRRSVDNYCLGGVPPRGTNRSILQVVLVQVSWAALKMRTN